MGDTRRRTLPVILAILAALAVGFAAPASASFGSLAPAPLTPAPTTASLAASVETPTRSLRTRLSWSRTPPGPRPYFGARYYGSRIGRFTSVDPLYTWNANLLNPQRWNRYAYGRNNPLRYVDPDGRDFIDYFGGVVNAFGSNLAFGRGRASGGNSDFRFGQSVGDSLSLIAAAFEANVGGGLMVGGGFLTATVAGAEVGVPALAAGGALVGHGAGVGTTALMHLSKNVGEPEGPKMGSEGGPGAGKRFSDRTKDAARGENPNCVFCDRPTTRQPGPTQSNIDHAKAKSRGGNNTRENAQNTCRECNQTKGTKSTEEFLKPE